MRARRAANGPPFSDSASADMQLPGGFLLTGGFVEAKQTLIEDAAAIARQVTRLAHEIVEKNSGNPTYIFYSDKFLKIIIVLWLISFYLIVKII